jgi:hypothetical protein
MHVIKARNVNDAYRQGLALFNDGSSTLKLPSRAGNVTEYVDPVTTVYTKPWERILWDSKRDCNPFFHLFESLWMLAGHNDSAYLVELNKKMGDFANPDGTYHGAYGFRWRHWFGFDQIEECIATLSRDSMTRRCVMSMWSANGDLLPTDAGGISPDLPCNLMIKFEARRDELDMTVFNRSNDMIWGAYGANAVHMSFLQEFVAGALRLPIGRYWQVSGNFHVYDDVWGGKVRPDGYVDHDLYLTGALSHTHIFEGCAPNLHGVRRAFNDIEAFVEDGERAITGMPFLSNIASPLYRVWGLWKKDRAKAYYELLQMPNQDDEWVTACRLWMQRRISK